MNEGMTGTPESGGFDGRHLAAIATALRNGALRNVHGVVVVRTVRVMRVHGDAEVTA